MAAQVVQDHDITGSALGSRHLLRPGSEAVAVDRPSEYTRCVDPIVPERCQESRRLPLSVWYPTIDLLSLWCPAIAWRHVGGCSGFVDNDQMFSMPFYQLVSPIVTCLGDAFSRLLDRPDRFFSRDLAFLPVSRHGDRNGRRATLGEACAKLGNGQIRPLRDPLPNLLLVLQQRRPLEPTELYRCNITSHFESLHQLDDAAWARPELNNHFSTCIILQNRTEDFLAKAIRIQKWHA
jgi:hypothetical protein